MKSWVKSFGLQNFGQCGLTVRKVIKLKNEKTRRYRRFGIVDFILEMAESEKGEKG